MLVREGKGGKGKKDGEESMFSVLQWAATFGMRLDVTVSFYASDEK